jgi:hypothetical protein
MLLDVLLYPSCTLLFLYCYITCVAVVEAKLTKHM